jgi:nicotinamide riboside kinase
MKDLPAPAPVPGRISVVGPCSSGKSELVGRLLALGMDARHCAQEHSYVPDMWQRISRPEVLIYLDASAEAIARRRHAQPDPAYLARQQERLSHARRHCHIYIDTDLLDPDAVADTAVAALRRLGLCPRNDA